MANKNALCCTVCFFYVVEKTKIGDNKKKFQQEKIISDKCAIFIWLKLLVPLELLRNIPVT